MWLFLSEQELVRSSSEDLCLGEDNAYTPVAVLFSGGLDSMILAALLDECLQPDCMYGVYDSSHWLHSKYI